MSSLAITFEQSYPRQEAVLDATQAVRECDATCAKALRLGQAHWLAHKPPEQCRATSKVSLQTRVKRDELGSNSIPREVFEQMLWRRMGIACRCMVMARHRAVPWDMSWFGRRENVHVLRASSSLTRLEHADEASLFFIRAPLVNIEITYCCCFFMHATQQTHYHKRHTHSHHPWHNIT